MRISYKWLWTLSFSGFLAGSREVSWFKPFLKSNLPEVLRFIRLILGAGRSIDRSLDPSPAPNYYKDKEVTLRLQQHSWNTGVLQDFLEECQQRLGKCQANEPSRGPSLLNFIKSVSAFTLDALPKMSAHMLVPFCLRFQGPPCGAHVSFQETFHTMSLSELQTNF